MKVAVTSLVRLVCGVHVVVVEHVVVLVHLACHLVWFSEVKPKP